MAIELNRSDLSAHMGVSLPTIDRWVKEGCPVVQRGRRGVEWVFDLPEVIRWWGNRCVEAASGDSPSDLAEIERRTALAKMQQAELTLAKAKGEVAPIREFERAQAKVFAEIRANIMNVPQRVVVQLLNESDETRFKQVLRSELTLALEAAANAELILENEEDDVESDS